MGIKAEWPALCVPFSGFLEKCSPGYVLQVGGGAVRDVVLMLRTGILSKKCPKRRVLPGLGHGFGELRDIICQRDRQNAPPAGLRGHVGERALKNGCGAADGAPAFFFPGHALLWYHKEKTDEVRICRRSGARIAARCFRWMRRGMPRSFSR